MSSASCWTVRQTQPPNGSDRRLNWDGQLTYDLRRTDAAKGRRIQKLPFVKSTDGVAVNTSVTTSGLPPPPRALLPGGDTGAKRAGSTLFRWSET